MKRVRVRDLEQGDTFYEVDHGVAVKWVALEDAHIEKTGTAFCLCLRKDGTQIIFRDFCRPQLTRDAQLFDKINPKDKIEMI